MIEQKLIEIVHNYIRDNLSIETKEPSGFSDDYEKFIILKLKLKNEIISEKYIFFPEK